MNPESEESSSTSVVAKVKLAKGPHEDAWLRTRNNDPDIDRNLLDSLRRAYLNPDLVKPHIMHCYCGAVVDLEASWYVMTLDGNLVCNTCARCHCCGRDAMLISRRLVSIDGLVLCYRCVQFFGHARHPKFQARVEPQAMKHPLEVQAPVFEGSTNSGGGVTPSPIEDSPSINLSNSEYYDYNVTRIDRICFTPKEDLRRRLRSRYYDPPVERLARSDNPSVVPPAYLADDSRMPPMLCPACNLLATGPKCYVVPAMARVYHRRCFRCSSCKEKLTSGLQIPYLHFEYCSCHVPQVWCTKPACVTARHLHHKVGKCHLGCLRPGGRNQMDYASESPQKQRRCKQAKHTQEQQQQQEHPSSNPLTLPSSDRTLQDNRESVDTKKTSCCSCA